MGTQPEARLQRRIQEAIRDEGHFVFKVHGGPYTMVGLPDLIVCAEGLFIGLEVKLPTTRNNTSDSQKIVHQRIRDHGGVCEVVTSPEEALAVIRKTLGGER